MVISVFLNLLQPVTIVRSMNLFYAFITEKRLLSSSSISIISLSIIGSLVIFPNYLWINFYIGWSCSSIKMTNALSFLNFLSSSLNTSLEWAFAYSYFNFVLSSGFSYNYSMISSFMYWFNPEQVDNFYTIWFPTVFDYFIFVST